MSAALRICLLLAVLLAGAAGCSLFSSSRVEQTPPWAITLMEAGTTNGVPHQEWLVIEGELLDSPRFQRFIDTAQIGSTWTAPVGNRTYRWQIDNYNPFTRKVVVKRYLGE